MFHSFPQIPYTFECESNLYCALLFNLFQGNSEPFSKHENQQSALYFLFFWKGSALYFGVCKIIKLMEKKTIKQLK